MVEARGEDDEEFDREMYELLRPKISTILRCFICELFRTKEITIGLLLCLAGLILQFASLNISTSIRTVLLGLIPMLIFFFSQVGCNKVMGQLLDKVQWVWWPVANFICILPALLRLLGFLSFLKMAASDRELCLLLGCAWVVCHVLTLVTAGACGKGSLSLFIRLTVQQQNPWHKLFLLMAHLVVVAYWGKFFLKKLPPFLLALGIMALQYGARRIPDVVGRAIKRYLWTTGQAIGDHLELKGVGFSSEAGVAMVGVLIVSWWSCGDAVNIHEIVDALHESVSNTLNNIHKISFDGLGTAFEDARETVLTLNPVKLCLFKPGHFFKCCASFCAYAIFIALIALGHMEMPLDKWMLLFLFFTSEALPAALALVDLALFSLFKGSFFRSEDQPRPYIDVNRKSAVLDFYQNAAAGANAIHEVVEKTMQISKIAAVGSSIAELLGADTKLVTSTIASGRDMIKETLSNVIAMFQETYHNTPGAESSTPAW